MADNLKPIPQTIPPLRVNRRREGQQGKNQHGQSEEQKDQGKSPSKKAKNRSTDSSADSQKIEDFHNLLDGRH